MFKENFILICMLRLKGVFRKIYLCLMTIFLLTTSFAFLISDNNLPDNVSKEYMVNAVNLIRVKGCYCGNKWMKPVPPIEWHDKLYQSAYIHAKDMHSNKFFDHLSSEGLNIGQRLEKIGYKWIVAGENLGEGQRTFDEVVQDWLLSESHCKMLMHPRVKEMGVARYKMLWVQHFGSR